MGDAHLEHFGNIDIYLFDQLARSRVQPGMRILDAGCGSGRNLAYFFREDYEAFAIDESPQAIDAVKSLRDALCPRLPDNNFRAEPVESMSLASESVDFVISSAVLHFARDTEHFEAMLSEMTRVLRPKGILFCRTASVIGLETLAALMERGDDRRFRLPDRSERYLVDEAQLMDATRRIPGSLLDPLKTTLVQGQRSMTTWVVAKR